MDPKLEGFDIKSRSHELVMQDVVGYLPTINAPVTQLDLASVYPRLRISWTKLVRSPGSTKIPTLRFLILRLGTFHTIFNHFTIISKRS